MMYALSKLNRQNEQTWVNLQKRLNKVQFSYKELFPNSDVHDFIKNKAVSVGSCEGYFIPSLLTTTAFLLASKGARVQTLYGIQGTALNWFKSYLTNRTQRCFVNGSLSRICSLKCGLPWMYADDAHITYAGVDVNSIQLNLNRDLDNLNK